MWCAKCNCNHFFSTCPKDDEPSYNSLDLGNFDLLPKSFFELNVNPDPIIPTFEPLIPPVGFNINPDPIIPAFEPLIPTFGFNINPDPIIPAFEPLTPTFGFNINPDPIIPAFEPLILTLGFNINPDPIIPTFEPLIPTFDFNVLPDPVILPPTPVRDIDNSIIGWKPELENKIYTGLGGNGPVLNISPGGFVNDVLGNVVGQMGPANTISPPNFPQMPEYGPPQSTPDAWDPGFSPIKPLG